MLSLTKTGAPETVTVEGAFFRIKADFRYWIMFSQMIRENHTYLDYDFLYEGEKPENRKAGFESLFAFFIDKHELPKVKESEGGRKAIDYEKDADLIFSAFYEVYGIDLTEVKLHWHKFRALLNGLHGTKLNEVIGYRLYDDSEKKDFKKAMLELQEMWALPEEITDEEQKAIDDFDAQLKD